MVGRVWPVADGKGAFQVLAVWAVFCLANIDSTVIAVLKSSKLDYMIFILLFASAYLYWIQVLQSPNPKRSISEPASGPAPRYEALALTAGTNESNTCHYRILAEPLSCRLSTLHQRVWSIVCDMASRVKVPAQSQIPKWLLMWFVLYFGWLQNSSFGCV